MAKYSIRRRKIICDALRKGASRSAAAEAADITYTTLCRWVREGRKGSDEKYVRFLEAVEHAEAEVELELISKVKDYAPKDWRAAAWLLERRHPDRWGHRQKIEHSGPNGGGIPLEFAKMTEAQLRALAGGEYDNEAPNRDEPEEVGEEG